ncbi:MAG: PD40 domain-containing protein [Chitinophagaceae bacterium]|nr:PD40 domain-containing protein [Chitinophagaceae bacterium]
MKAGFIQNVLTFFLGSLLMGSGCARSSNGRSQASDSTASSQPALRGRLVFHSYSCYTCNDSKLYLYDFASNSLVLLSNGWNIINPMNAHFAPDGKSIVFMGMTTSSGWDIFRWRIGAASSPQNLTASFGATRDEDPKYSIDGNRIVFKQNGRMKEMDTLGNITRTVTVTHTEASMPYYTKSGDMLLYSGNEVAGSTADIYSVSLTTNSIQTLSAITGVEEYYPITRDDTSFLFTRWYSPTNHNDQVYLGFLNGRAFQRLSFNEADQNYSDAFPVDNRYVILSSTRSGGKGAYDLYVADMITGNKWSLSLYRSEINSSGNDLGACYSK